MVSADGVPSVGVYLVVTRDGQHVGSQMLPFEATRGQRP
jgi:hypothetical protein